MGRTLDQTNGAEWKDLRKAMSPTFTSGKIKGMMDLVGDTVDNLIVELEEKTEGGREAVVEVKQMFQALALDVIAKCAFGLENNSFKNPDNRILTHSLDILLAFQVRDMTTALFNRLL